MIPRLTPCCFLDTVDVADRSIRLSGWVIARPELLQEVPGAFPNSAGKFGEVDEMCRKK
jgi:hypothetical protein